MKAIKNWVASHYLCLRNTVIFVSVAFGEIFPQITAEKPRRLPQIFYLFCANQRPFLRESAGEKL